MQCHPVVHQHIDGLLSYPNLPDKKDNDKNHEIRIGGGIDNAFLFLFQFAVSTVSDSR